jgi:DNA-binding transcriptional MerR regulator
MEQSVNSPSDEIKAMSNFDNKLRLHVVDSPAIAPLAEPVLIPPPQDPNDQSERMLQVGDLARAVGKTVRAIHLYEELGLLHPHSRSKGRYRLYGPDALIRTRWIGKLQELGLSLNDIRTVVHEWECSPSAPGAMGRMREVYQSKLAETREQIERLRTLEKELAASLDYLETCDRCDPERLLPACSSCDLHSRVGEPPELVAGLSAHSH